MIRSFISLAITIIVIFASASFAAKQDTIDYFDLGKSSFDAGKFDEAYDHFFKAFALDPGSPATNFYLGRAAFEKGDFESAVMAFERVLIMQHDAMRVKLEIARCFFKLKSYELAKQYFTEVLEAKPPETVRKNIENFLAAITAAEKRHFFSIMIAAGYNWDDNVRVAPSNDKIRTVIGDVTLAGSTATPQSDRIFNTTAVINYVYRFPNERTVWKTTGLNYNAIYQFEDDLDQTYFSLTSGPEIKIGKFSWGIHGILNHLDLEYDRYLGTLGLGSILTFAQSPYYIFNIGGSWEKKLFFQNKDKDAMNLKANASSIFIFQPNRFGITFRAESEDAKEDTNSYSRWGVTLSYGRMLPFDFVLSSSFKYQKTDYEDTEELFGMKRSDELKDIKVGLSKTLWRSSDNRQVLSLMMNYTHTDSDSNIDLYIYDKNVTTSTLQFSF